MYNNVLSECSKMQVNTYIYSDEDVFNFVQMMTQTKLVSCW